MAAPLVLVVLAAVTVRAALYRSSLAVFIAERVEVASPLNAWKRGEARGGGAEEPRRQDLSSLAAGRDPGRAPGWKRPRGESARLRPGPGRAVLVRARTRAARKGPGQLCPGGAREGRCSATLGGGRAVGLEAEDGAGTRTSRFTAGGDTGNVTRTGASLTQHRACGSIGLDRARSAVPVQAPCPW